MLLIMLDRLIKYMKKGKIQVSIIIVNYNLTQSIRSLLKSIREFVNSISYEVIVVDNNSPDRSIEQLATEFPDFRFLFLKTNFGFGHGNNVGFQNSNGEYLLLLNPDTYLVDNLPLGLYNFAKDDPNCAIIGPKMIFPDGKFQVSTGKFPGIFTEIGDLSGLSIRITRITNFYKFKIAKKKVWEVDYIFGSCMMINAKLYKEINGFDEKFFLFAEETDLCYRVRKNTNRKIIYYTDEKIVHLKSLVTGNNMPLRMELGYKSKLKYYNKNYNILYRFMIKNVIVLLLILKHLTLFRKKNERKNYKKAYHNIINHYLKSTYSKVK